MFQPREQGPRRQELDPRRRQLNREGQAVEPLSDARDHGRVLLVEDQTRPGGPGALHEQPHRLAARDRRDRGGLQVGHLQWGDLELLLAADVKRRAAGHHDPQLGRGLQERGDHRRRGDQVLKVVEQQQDPRRLEVAAQPVKQRPVTDVA